MHPSSKLRRLLAGPDIVVAPGAYDALTARLIEQAGFDVAYMTGAGVSAAHGFPDFGLLTMTEMVGSAAAIARSISIPLISDADTGYGNELNVTRTVREFEMRGVAAIHLEDQVAPKRCGHLEGKDVTSREEFLAKIRAAVAARRDPDFVIVARSDARAVADLDEAIERANLALAAGADVAFVESPFTLEEAASVPRRVNGPCLLNVVPGGRTPHIDLTDAQTMGYRLAILPGLLLTSVVESCDAALRSLKSSGSLPLARPSASVMEAFRRFGADDWSKLRTKFQADATVAMPASPETAAAK